MPTDADIIAFGFLVSGMAMAVGFFAFMILCFTSGGPFGATWTMTMWGWKLLRKHPFPVGTLIYWASTTDAFPGAPTAKALVATGWGIMIAGGGALLVLDAAMGPKETRYFTDPVTGQPRVERSRMREKRVVPPKLDKAVRATLPARDRFAYELDARRWAKNQQRAGAGLPPLEASWARQKMAKALPTGKTKDPKLPRVERKSARRDARAEVAGLPPRPPKAPDMPAGPKVGNDPAAPPRPPVNLAKAGA